MVFAKKVGGFSLLKKRGGVGRGVVGRRGN